jgi:hypothetical protein
MNVQFLIVFHDRFHSDSLDGRASSPSQSDFAPLSPSVSPILFMKDDERFLFSFFDLFEFKFL